jgi:hypothetical protein
MQAMDCGSDRSEKNGQQQQLTAITTTAAAAAAAATKNKLLTLNGQNGERTQQWNCAQPYIRQAGSKEKKKSQASTGSKKEPLQQLLKKNSF